MRYQNDIKLKPNGIMEKKEFSFNGTTLNGFLMLFVNITLTIAAIASMIWGIIIDNNLTGLYVAGSIVTLIATTILWCGFVMLEPGEGRVMVLFGKYRGTFTKTGYYWLNPFLTVKKVSLRSRNIDVEPIKVNDKTGNPIMIGLILVWKLRDTYKAMFEIDSQTMAQSGNGQSNQVTIGTASLTGIMNALENFVRTQSDAALRQVASLYAYDNTDNDSNELTLRSGGEEINTQLEEKLSERLAMAGIEIVEARINYLAYAPEIAAVMLRRQQASAIIMAREKIVEGAVSMVKMALNKLADEDIVELDDDKKAAMVSNLLVVLCGDESAQPVVNTGTLNH